MRMAYPFRPLRKKRNKSEVGDVKENIPRLKPIKKRPAVHFSVKQSDPDSDQSPALDDNPAEYHQTSTAKIISHNPIPS
jgi:hypothetical protein